MPTTSTRARLAAMVLLCGIALAACSSDSETDKDASVITPPEHALLADKVLNIAHRGGGLLAPEETMLAFQSAVDANVDVLEMDARSTKDGVIVLMHDADVDRTTDGTGPLSELTYAQVLELDAGYKFSTDSGSTFPFRGMGTKVARLQDVLEAYPTMLFSIEIKEPPIAEQVLAIVVAAGLLDRVVIAAFHDLTLRRVRELEPEVLTTLTIEESLELVRLDAEGEESYQPPTWVLHTPPTFGDLVVDAALVARANRFGIKIHVWTVNETSEMQDLLDIGVHGIMSDDPIALGGLLPSP